MKSNKFLIASLLILIGMGAITISCNKEKTGVRKAQMIVDEGCEKDGGDDEDPAIMVRVKKNQTFAPVDSATVEIFDYATSLRVASGVTDSLGAFEDHVVAGIYFFRVTEQTNPIPYVTDTVHVNKNIQVTVLVD